MPNINSPVMLEFDHATSLQWMAERTVFGLNKAYRGELSRERQKVEYDKVINQFSQKGPLPSTPEDLKKDYDRSRIYIYLDDRNFANAQQKIQALNAIKNQYRDRWDNNQLHYGQGDFGGGPYSQNLESMDNPTVVNYCIHLAYINDKNEKCGITLKMGTSYADRNSPPVWSISLMRNNDQLNEKGKVALFYGKNSSNEVDDKFNVQSLDKINDLKEAFFNFLQSKRLQKEFENLFIFNKKTIVLNPIILEKFSKDVGLYHPHVYKFVLDEPLLSLTSIKPVIKNYFSNIATGSTEVAALVAVGFTISIALGFATFGLSFIVSIAIGAFLGALYGIYESYKSPVPTNSFPKHPVITITDSPTDSPQESQASTHLGEEKSINHTNPIQPRKDINDIPTSSEKKSTDGFVSETSLERHSDSSSPKSTSESSSFTEPDSPSPKSGSESPSLLEIEDNDLNIPSSASESEEFGSPVKIKRSKRSMSEPNIRLRISTDRTLAPLLEKKGDSPLKNLVLPLTEDRGVITIPYPSTPASGRPTQSGKFFGHGRSEENPNKITRSQSCPTLSR